ncbi:MAG: hypothetical protein HY830_17145 [Actinobacteria bacterium]|nr:hypothetical protein [Actinomycetota bacterium]
MHPVTRTILGTVTAVAIATGGAGWVAAPAAAAGLPTTYTGPTVPATVVAPSADTQQSKVWRADGAWWAVMADTATGTPTIHELLTDHTWRDTGIAVDTRANSTADVETIGTTLYAASRTATGDLLFSRFTYSAGSRTYAKDSGYPVTITTGGTESLSIARDSAGKIWATWTKSSRVLYAYTTSSDAAWSVPDFVPSSDTTVATDDVSGIVAFNGHVGIMWSDQQSAAFRFAVHTDGAAAGLWTTETPLSGIGIADDHISLKAVTNDSLGRVFVALKTSNDVVSKVATDPLVVVLKRESNGTWQTATGATVADGATRPQVVIDSEHSLLYLLMTSPATGGVIYYKTSPLASLTFGGGRGAVFMKASGAKLNNISTTKDPVASPSGLVAIAADDTAHRYYHAELPLAPAGDHQPPTNPASVTSTVMSATSVLSRWPAGTDDVKVVSYDVYRDGDPIGTTTTLAYTDTTAVGGTTYRYGVRSVDAAGNVSSLRQGGYVTTPKAGGSVVVHGAAKAATAGATGITVTRPTTVVANDIMVVAVTVRTLPTLTAPSGWTRVVQTDNGTALRQAVYWKKAGASEPASYRWTFSASRAGTVQLVAYKGLSTTAPVRAFAGKANVSSATSTAPAVTSAAGDRVLTVFGTARTGAITPMAGLTERTEATVATGTTLTAETADKQIATTGTAGPFTATTSTGAAVSIGHTLSLRWA